MFIFISSPLLLHALNDNLTSIQVVQSSKTVTRASNVGKAEVFSFDIPDGYKLICPCGFALGSHSLKNSSMVLYDSNLIRMDIFNMGSQSITADCHAFALIIKI